MRRRRRRRRTEEEEEEEEKPEDISEKEKPKKIKDTAVRIAAIRLILEKLNFIFDIQFIQVNI